MPRRERGMSKQLRMLRGHIKSRNKNQEKNKPKKMQNNEQRKTKNAKLPNRKPEKKRR